jgi:hypothetical protein
MANILFRIISLFFGRQPMTSGREYHEIPAASSVSSSSSPCYSDLAAELNQDEQAYIPHSQQTFQGGCSIESPVTLTFSTKELELSKIIHDIQSFVLLSSSTSANGPNHGREAHYTRMNTRLNLWQHTLPSEMRWSRWCTNLESIDQGLATLQYVQPNQSYMQLSLTYD